jgi:hypothetical protein
VTKLSGVVVEPNQSASALMGACLQGQTATLNGFACGRAADVYGIALDKCGGLVVTWPAQARQQSDGTYVSQQTAGPKLLSCARHASNSSVKAVHVIAHPAHPAHRTASAVAGRRLANSGLSPAIPAAAFLLVVTGLVGMRRRTRTE